MNQIDFSFAYRCREAVPNVPLHHAQWPEHNYNDLPKPPEEWQRGGFQTGWLEWRSGRRLSGNDICRRDIYSVVWSQLSQTYWVVPWDCTKRTTPRDEWLTLHCRKLGDTGLWKLLEAGERLQHDSRCPDHFDQFLPKNFFNGRSVNAPCHFVAKLTLMLALVAMVPGKLVDIPTYINQAFYRPREPRFVPLSEPMDRHIAPGRGIVMETAYITGARNSTQPVVEAWENGLYGPMISSHDPNDNDWTRWLSWRNNR